MKDLLIGGVLRSVPNGYLKMESEFTALETKEFYKLIDGTEKEKLREIILMKRCQFYDRYAAGMVIIPEPIQPKKTLLYRFGLWLRK